MKKREKKKLIFFTIASLVLGVLFAWSINSGFFESWHLRSSNFLFIQAENEALDDIVIVAIDDKALELRSASEIGTLQFAKADYAKVIKNLEEAGVAAIGIDVIFSEKSTEEDQQALIDVLDKHSNIILAAEPKTRDRPGLKPLQPFVDASSDKLGSVQFIPDKDNTVRRQSVVFDDDLSPKSFAVQVINAYLGQPSEVNQLEDKQFVLSTDTVRVGKKRIQPMSVPLGNDSKLLINFFGRPNSFQTISMADVFENKFVSKVSGEDIDLKNKIVLIGEVGTALHDVQIVPVSFGTAMPGVEIHANAIQTMLTQRFLAEQSQFSAIIVDIILLLLGLLLFLHLRIRWSVAVFILAMILYTITTWVSFEYGLILNTIYPYLAILLAFVVSYLYRYFYEERQAKHAKSAFGRYVSPHVVHEILEDPEQLKLGGQKRNLTVFFSDIAGFTSISEKLTPEELVEQLNEYLDEMSEVILEQDGTIDKYIGDAIMAFWGAPLDQPDHALRACKTALEYQRRLKKLNIERVKRGEMEFAARVGLNTGDMVVGNIGSSKRFDYTVIGDAVNLGARLEGVNKVYGTLIMISEYTHALVKDQIEVRELDLITVKGKTEPVRIFELLSMKGELDKKRTKIRDAFAQGLKAYRQQKWQQAIESFRQVLNIDEKDGPAKVYIERCEQLKTADLPNDWDGVFVLKTK